MIPTKFICVILFHFSLSVLLENNNHLSSTQGSRNLSQNKKLKREIDLEIFDDIFQVHNKKIDKEVVYICGVENEVGCTCNTDDEILICSNNGIKTANLRPVNDDFVIQNVNFRFIKNLILKKDKTFPGSEETITKIWFYEIESLKMDNNIFDNFISLRRLDFSKTRLSINNFENILTEKLGKVLYHFGIHNCDWDNINPEIFKNLVNLSSLYLNGNEQSKGTFFGKFPETLSNLATLVLIHSNLTSLSEDTFVNLKNLEDLYLCGNRFTTIPNAIKCLSNLKVFSLGWNELEKVIGNAFASNDKLETIYLSGNSKLKTVESCAFCGLENSLKEIHFEQCFNLSFFDENAFGAISNGYSNKMEKFYISDCNISVLHENLLDWKNIKNFDLIGNPFACNCSMAWLFRDLMSHNSVFESKLTSMFHVDRHHHKFKVGCLGPPPTTLNHTIPNTVVEIFASCESTFSKTNKFWYFQLLMFFIVITALVTYANRISLPEVFSPLIFKFF